MIYLVTQPNWNSLHLSTTRMFSLIKNESVGIEGTSIMHSHTAPAVGTCPSLLCSRKKKQPISLAIFVSPRLSLSTFCYRWLDTVVVYTINYADSGWAGDICPRLHCMRNQSLWVPGGVWYVTACSILCCSWSSKTLDTNFIPLSPYPSSHYRSQGWNLKKLTEGHHQVSRHGLVTQIPILFICDTYLTIFPLIRFSIYRSGTCGLIWLNTGKLIR